MGGSIGSVVGKKITLAIEKSILWNYNGIVEFFIVYLRANCC